MNSIDDGRFSQAPTFRQTKAIALWSAHLTLEVPYADFKKTTVQAAQSNGQGYSGFITEDNRGHVTSFTRTRYPRIKYGIVSIQECEEGMQVLASDFGSTLELDKQHDDIRVVMGLKEGYDERAPTHDVDEVCLELSAAEVFPAEVFAVRHTNVGTSVYTEPVAVIKAPAECMPDVYMLGDRLKQERFTIEDFGRGISYAVETRFCTEPD
jgi:hypothetical protein